MKHNYIIRQEAFGYVFYDKTTLSYSLIGTDELETYLSKKKISLEDCEITNTPRLRRDILYSPIRVYYELTLSCNLQCRYCFNSSGKARLDELNTQQVLDSLDVLKQSHVLDIRFTGGEFTQRHDWYAILSKAKVLGFCVSCNTNANYFHQKIIDQLASLNLDQVTISVDGTQEHHEFNRGRGTYQRLISNIQYMHKLGIKLRINTLVSKFNIHDVDFMINFASKYATEINFFVVRFIGRGFNLETECSVDMQAFKKMSDRAISLRSKYPNLRILCFGEVTKNTSIKSQLSHKLGLKPGIPGSLTTLNITSDGKLWLNGYVPYVDKCLSLGNITKQNLVSVWQNSPILEMQRNTGRDLMQFCEQCKFSKNCIGANYENELNRMVNERQISKYCKLSPNKSLLSYL